MSARQAKITRKAYRRRQRLHLVADAFFRQQDSTGLQGQLDFGDYGVLIQIAARRTADGLRCGVARAVGRKCKFHDPMTIIWPMWIKCVEFMAERPLVPPEATGYSSRHRHPPSA